MNYCGAARTFRASGLRPRSEIGPSAGAGGRVLSSRLRSDGGSRRFRSNGGRDGGACGLRSSAGFGPSAGAGRRFRSGTLSACGFRPGSRTTRSRLRPLGDFAPRGLPTCGFGTGRGAIYPGRRRTLRTSAAVDRRASLRAWLFRAGGGRAGRRFTTSAAFRFIVVLRKSKNRKNQ